MEEQRSGSMAFEDKLRSMILGNETATSSPSVTESSDAIILNSRNGRVDSTTHKSHKQTRFTVQPPKGSARQGMTPTGNEDCSHIPNQNQGIHAMEPAYVVNMPNYCTGAAFHHIHPTEDISRNGPDYHQSAHFKALNKRTHAIPHAKSLQPAQNVSVIRNPRAQYQRRNKYLPIGQVSQINSTETRLRQIKFLQDSLQEELPNLIMKQSEVTEKEAFRIRLTNVCESTIKSRDKILPPVDLVCFGSLSSGYATAGSDMDLAVVPRSASSPLHTALTKDGLPRILEQAFLSERIGARLLTKTRVPILKVCESPSAELLSTLREIRQKWEKSSDEDTKVALVADGEGAKAPDKPFQAAKPIFSDDDFPSLGDAKKPIDLRRDLIEGREGCQEDKDANFDAKSSATLESRQHKKKDPRKRNMKTKERPRERRPNALDFPSHGVGTLCDINFSNPLAIHNTALLRCYSLCDSRVMPMVQYVKGWAKRRKINSSYSGTLSSYGYVLMVLHYLLNVANPPVLLNLQLDGFNGAYIEEKQIVDRYDVSFWRDEEHIRTLAAQGKLIKNHEPLGSLLRDFFHYYAATGAEVVRYGFSWFHDALSLRTRGGLIPKRSKGWVAAKTSVTKNHVGQSLAVETFFFFLKSLGANSSLSRTMYVNDIYLQLRILLS